MRTYKEQSGDAPDLPRFTTRQQQIVSNFNDAIDRMLAGQPLHPAMVRKAKKQREKGKSLNITYENVSIEAGHSRTLLWQADTESPYWDVRKRIDGLNRPVNTIRKDPGELAKLKDKLAYSETKLKYQQHTLRAAQNERDSAVKASKKWKRECQRLQSEVDELRAKLGMGNSNVTSILSSESHD